MPGSRTLHRHAALVNRMAEVLGVDLMAAIAGGELTGEDWRAAVLRCTGCEDPDACMQWLAGQTGAIVAPVPCRNTAMFDSLRGQTQQQPSSESWP